MTEFLLLGNDSIPLLGNQNSFFGHPRIGGLYVIFNNWKLIWLNENCCKYNKPNIIYLYLYIYLFTHLFTCTSLLTCSLTHSLTLFLSIFLSGFLISCIWLNSALKILKRLCLERNCYRAKDSHWQKTVSRCMFAGISVGRWYEAM